MHVLPHEVSTYPREVLWHVDPLLSADHRIGHCTMAVARQRPTNNRRMVFSARSEMQQFRTTVIGSDNRYEPNNGTEERNDVFYAVRVEML
jgi:hypothetical protein